MTIAVLNCRLLTLTSYKADIEFKIQRILEKKMYLSYQTIDIAEEKALAIENEDEAAQAKLEAKEDAINALEKIWDMEKQNLETQQQCAATELESIQKMLQNNIKREFKYLS